MDTKWFVGSFRARLFITAVLLSVSHAAETYVLFRLPLFFGGVVYCLRGSLKAFCDRLPSTDNPVNHANRDWCRLALFRFPQAPPHKQRFFARQDTYLPYRLSRQVYSLPHQSAIVFDF